MKNRAKRVHENLGKKLLSKISLFLFLIILLNKAVAQSDPYMDSLQTLIEKDLPDTNKIEHLNRLGWAMQYEDPAKAILLSKESLEICIQLMESDKVKNDPKIMYRIKRRLGQTFNCLGVFYWMASDYPESIRYHEKALEIRRSIGDRFNEASSLNNLGLVFKAQGNYNEAIKNYFAALSIAINEGDKGLISNNLTNIGTVYHDMDEYKKALDFYFMSVKLYKETGDMIGLSMTYSYIGNANVKLKNNEEALKYYDMGLTISKELQNTFLESFQLNNRGEVYAMMHDYKKALESYQESLPMSREVGDLALVSTVLCNMGQAYFDLGDYSLAEKYLNEGLEIAVEINALPEIEVNTQRLSELYAKTGRFEKAYEYQSKYIAAHDSMYNDNRTKELGQLETRHELALEAREKQRAEEERQRMLKQEKNRKELLQNSGIFLVLVLIGLAIMVLGFKKVSPKVASIVTFLATLLFFEFLLVLCDPLIDNISNGEPVYKLLFNAVIAVMIFPVHAFLESRLKKRLVRK